MSHSPCHHVQWEYHVLYRPHQTDLNALGQQGWELVSVTNVAPGTANVVGYLKRRVVSAEPQTQTPVAS